MPMTTQARTTLQLLAIAEAAEALLNRIDRITTADFAEGGERVEREALRAALAAGQ